jgi:DNA-binding IclR family transcriptional regulator
MTVTQIAKAIEYNPAWTETALQRLASGGQVLRDQAGRWAIALEASAKMDDQAYAAE